MKRFSNSLIAIIIATLFMGVIALPNSVKSMLPNDPISNWIKSKNITLGLDLQGGTQLDYRIDLRDINRRNEDDNKSNDVVVHDVIQGVRATIERRVNGLGVAEPQIYLSEVAGEQHIIVELAGIKDVNEAKAVVGKTIQLEFKEPKEEIDNSEKEIFEKEADEVLKNVLVKDVNFSEIGEKTKTSDNKIEFRKETTSFESDLVTHYKNILPKLKEGEIYKKVIEGSDGFVVRGAGDISEKKVLTIVQLISKEKNDKVIETKEEVSAGHILIAYEGSEKAPEGLTRTKDEAEEEAERLLSEVKESPESFSDLAKENSDGPSASKGGDLGTFGKGQMTKDFEDAAYSLNKDEISEVVETEFGFHIIKRTNEKTGDSENTINETEYIFNEIVFDISPSQWKATGLDGSSFKFATVTYTNIGTPQVNIQFDGEGADMFEDITGRLKGKQLAIFVGGELISAPRVNEKISGGNAVITGSYSLQEAMQLANDLNTGAIDAPIILSGQYTISATLGDDALQKSLMAGIIGLLVLGLFMIFYYRALGVFAVIALSIYGIIILFILKTMPLVMTLAGIAGIILSIGMAVDANILIFERTKEELNEGKGFSAAISAGFDRAWTSIRDSNVSSLITCTILYIFGNSIIKGFALMLGLGTVISMFTAITVTRTFLQALVGTWITKQRWLLGAKELEELKK